MYFSANITEMKKELTDETTSANENAEDVS